MKTFSVFKPKSTIYTPNCGTWGSPGKLVSPAQKRDVIDDVCQELGVSQRKACKTLEQSRSSQRYELTLPVKDATVVEAIRQCIKKRPRFGYRRITIELKKDGWYINFKRVYRIWQANDLKGPKRKGRKKRGRDGCSDNACNKKKPEYANHV